MEQCRPEAVYCLGDFIGYNSWANKVVNEVRKFGIPTIAGNCDQDIGRMSNDCGCAYISDEEKDMRKISIDFTNEIMKIDEHEYWRIMPADINAKFQLNKDQINLLRV